ncbi:hypothetical protein [Sphingorhabdus sp. M41]|uniref:hypothetical protein n=1 Tax=Sphingorhabdus sp. M41 TaxID=1806885 RepID=UPI00078ED629|nr:hypothetical protein [Sphingorhabdus sp. M41]AMO71423.1 hypothetical protein AZE99_05735 [Sphingorhabdus sp. M41]
MEEKAKSLTLEYEWSSDDDFGLLYVRVVNGFTRLESDFWVQWQDIVEFGQALEQPSKHFSKVEECWGQTLETGEHQTIIKILFDQINEQGHIDLSVELRDRDDPKKFGSTRFLVPLSSIASFRDEVRLMMDKKSRTATLYCL